LAKKELTKLNKIKFMDTTLLEEMPAAAISSIPGHEAGSFKETPEGMEEFFAEAIETVFTKSQEIDAIAEVSKNFNEMHRLHLEAARWGVWGCFFLSVLRVGYPVTAEWNRFLLDHFSDLSPAKATACANIGKALPYDQRTWDFLTSAGYSSPKMAEPPTDVLVTLAGLDTREGKRGIATFGELVSKFWCVAEAKANPSPSAKDDSSGNGTTEREGTPEEEETVDPAKEYRKHFRALLKAITTAGEEIEPYFEEIFATEHRTKADNNKLRAALASFATMISKLSHSRRK
jgi:hypothetical protein